MLVKNPFAVKGKFSWGYVGEIKDFPFSVAVLAHTAVHHSGCFGTRSYKVLYFSIDEIYLTS